MGTKGICPNCNKFIGFEKLTLDHHPPISKVQIGFVYTIDHIFPLCFSCNSSKGNKIIYPLKIQNKQRVVYLVKFK